MNRLRKWMTLAALPGWGSVRVKKFVASRGSLDGAWDYAAREVAGFSNAMTRIEQAIQMADDRGDWSISWEDPSYPARWRAMPDAPVVMHGRGRDDIGNSNPFVGIVGTRKCSELAANLAFKISGMLVKQGWSIASGLAHGVDAAAHRGALFEQGITVACLGHGLDRIYPNAHRRLAHSMVKNEGALLTEYLPGSQPAPWQFAARNRLVVGLSEALVMMESPKKGGAMVSAACAIESGQDLWVYQPKQWSRRWEGNQALIEAFPDTAWSDPEDLVGRMDRAIANRTPPKSKEAHVPEALRSVWLSLAGSSGKLLEQLMLEHQATREQMTRRLFLLELAGKVQRLPGGWYVPLVSARGQVV
jgi:DNA processing protein